MLEWLKKPAIWILRQSKGKAKGDAAFARYENKMEQLYRDLTPDELEAALDTLVKAVDSILATKKGRG